MRPIPPEQSLIEYPCAFPIKVMGAHVEGFAAAITQVALQFDPGFDPEAAANSTSGMGVDKGSYPCSKKVVLGLNIEF